ncbi:MAG: hypothetical protein WC966_12565, partial [Bradymonadales bacterium]
VEKAVNIFNSTTNYHSVTNVTAQNVVVSGDDPAEKLFTRYCSLLKRGETDLAYKTFSKLVELHPDSPFVDEARIHAWQRAKKTGDYGDTDCYEWYNLSELYSPLSALQSGDEKTFEKYYTPLKELLNDRLSKLTGLNFTGGMPFAKLLLRNAFETFPKALAAEKAYDKAMRAYDSASQRSQAEGKRFLDNYMSGKRSPMSAVEFPPYPDRPENYGYDDRAREALTEWVYKDFEPDALYLAYIYDSFMQYDLEIWDHEDGDVYIHGYGENQKIAGNLVKDLYNKYSAQILPHMDEVKAARSKKEAEEAQKKLKRKQDNFRKMYANAVQKYEKKEYEKLSEALKSIAAKHPSPSLEAYAAKNVVKGLFGWKCKEPLPDIETAFKWAFPE